MRECTGPDIGDAIWYDHGRETVAGSKNANRKGRDGCGDGDIGESGATAKGEILDGRDTLRDDGAGEAAAARAGGWADGGYAGWDGERSGFAGWIKDES